MISARSKLKRLFRCAERKLVSSVKSRTVSPSHEPSFLSDSLGVLIKTL